MNKDFDKWNIYKKLVESRDYIFTFHEGDIWNCYIGHNIGCEECGKNDFLRPVFVLWKVSKHGFIGIPTTTKTQLIEDWFLGIKYTDKKTEKDGCLLMTQIRFFDAKRLAYYIGKTTKREQNKIRQKLAKILKIQKNDPSTVK